MKIKIELWSLFVLIVFSSAAWAENSKGNGGGAWICKDQRNEITSIELYDLSTSAFPVERNSEAYFAQLSKRVNRLRSHSVQGLGQTFLESAARIDREKEILPPGERLDNTGDHGLPLTYRTPGAGCGFEQLANYFQGRLFIVGDFWNSPLFSETDRAALIAHETLYLAARNANRATADSVKIRPVVAALFSSSETWVQLQAWIRDIYSLPSTSWIHLSQLISSDDEEITFSFGTGVLNLSGAALTPGYSTGDSLEKGEKVPSSAIRCKRRNTDQCSESEIKSKTVQWKSNRSFKVAELLGRSLRVCSAPLFNSPLPDVKLWSSSSEEIVDPADQAAIEWRDERSEVIARCAVYSFY